MFLSTVATGLSIVNGVSSLFGGGGGGGGGGTAPSATTTSSPSLSPAEQAMRQKVWDNALAAFNSNQKVLAAKGGASTVATPVGPSANTQQGWTDMLGFLNGGMRGQLTDVNSAQNFGLTKAIDVNNNPALQGAMDAATRPMIDQFQNAGGILQSIRDNSVQAGGYGGSRQGIAEGLAARGLEQKVGDIRATMASDAYGKGLDTMAKTLSLSPQVANLNLLPGQAKTAIGGSSEGYTQAANNATATKNASTLSAPWAPVNNLANIIYGGTQAGSSTTSTTSSGTPGTSQQLGTLSNILNGLGGMFGGGTGASNNIWGMTA